ncbi:GNAT family N-acetyltransferase [Xaviernesmea oryzae]|uniref:GNAT family N-acetyltransferase n=1 Tax=Xaviernesmea oryzae TaxID=464029 RepID=A0A1Q9AZ94_9HYPH|nr:N-acetyltransferase [Xaviernesmea oryzae]OLP61004.1 GNAT family N-acetyltransferase [Xaviernesmea oryzae]SEL17719.1 Predicted N-acetyltransferase YhbS [Xaviernesmea oryzae]
MAAVLDAAIAFFRKAEFTIEAEHPGDVVQRERLLDRAMGPARKRKSSEAIRRGRLPAQGLALVARDRDGHVIGTVRLWHVDAGVGPHGAAVPALLLGPLAVDADHEGKGIGAALMRAAVTEAAARGHGAILLVGDPEYYERFGFFAEKAAHLVMPGPFERRRFLGLELKTGWLDGAAGLLVPTGTRLSQPRIARVA